MYEITIIKLGGAAITDKSRPFTARPEIIKSIMQEINNINQSIILIHGAGSFAHNLAEEYNLANGFDPTISKTKQYQGISKVRASMQRLHQLILDSSEELRMNTFSIPISSTLVTSGQDKVAGKFFDPFTYALDHEFIPISYGDICFDASDMGFLVVSGDRIIQLLGQHFSEFNIRVIFGSDVDGFYDRPPQEKGAKLIPKIKYGRIKKWIKKAGKSSGIDVTGGMKGKLEQIRKLSQYVHRIDLINITVKDRLTDLLEGRDVLKTTFSKF